MAGSHSKNVAHNFSAGLALKLTNQVISFLVVKLLFINTLGTQYNGVSTLFSSILNVLALAELGISTAITYSLYNPIRTNDYRRIAALMNVYKKAYRLIAAFVFTAGMLCIPFLPYLVKNAPDIKESITLIFVLYIIKNSVSYLLAYKHTLLTASERRYEVSRIGLYFTLIRATIEFLVLYFTRDFILYLIVSILEEITRNWVISRRATKYFPEIEEYHDEQLPRTEINSLLKDISALSFYKVCNVALNSTDSIFIAMMPSLGIISVGNLGVYNHITNSIAVIVQQFYASFTPSLGVMATNATAEKQYKVFRTTNFVSFCAMCFCCTSLFCLLGPFITKICFPNKNLDMPLHIIGMIVFNFYTASMMRPTNAFRNGNGLFRQGKFRPLVMAAINIGMDLYLVHVWGIFGVLLSTSIARLVTQTWYDPWLLYRRVFKRPVKEYYWMYLGYTAVTIVSCAVTYYLCSILPPYNRFIRFFLQMILCVVISLSFIFVIYHKTDEYKDFIKRVMTLLGRRGKSGSRSTQYPVDESTEIENALQESSEVHIQAPAIKDSAIND